MKYPGPGLIMRPSLPCGPVCCYVCGNPIPNPTPMQRDAKKPCCGLADAWRRSHRNASRRARTAARGKAEDPAA